MRRKLLAASCIWALCLSASGMSAQDRFAVLAQNAIADVAGLRVVTIRDNHLAECYTLFIMEPRAEVDAAPVEESADDVIESVGRIRDAAEKRDQQLAELKARADKRSVPVLDPREPFRWYEAERRKIDEEYEQVLRTEMPSSYPWASSTPGMRSGSWEDSANAIRRSVVDPDPTSTMKTLTDRLARLDELLRRLAEAPRLAASGPVKCSIDASR